MWFFYWEKIAGISDTIECVLCLCVLHLTFLIGVENTTFQFTFSENKDEIYLFTFIEPSKGSPEGRPWKGIWVGEGIMEPQ